MKSVKEPIEKNEKNPHTARARPEPTFASINHLFTVAISAVFIDVVILSNVAATPPDDPPP